MNKQQKISRTRRMNFVDWFLIVLALVSVGVFVYFAFFSELGLFGKDEEKVSVEYTVRVESVNAQLLLGLNNLPEDKETLVVDFIGTGDKVYSCADGSLIGKVVSVEYERSQRPTGAYDANGNLIYADYTGYVDIIITVSSEGVDSDGVYSINGYEIRVGSDIDFRTEGYTATGKCTGVSGKEMSGNGN